MLLSIDQTEACPIIESQTMGAQTSLAAADRQGSPGLGDRSDDSVYYSADSRAASGQDVTDGAVDGVATNNERQNIGENGGGEEHPVGDESHPTRALQAHQVQQVQQVQQAQHRPDDEAAWFAMVAEEFDPLQIRLGDERNKREADLYDGDFDVVIPPFILRDDSSKPKPWSKSALWVLYVL